MFKLNTGFSHKSLMSLRRKISITWWLICNNFSEMIIHDLSWARGRFLVVEVESPLTNNVWTYSWRKTCVLVTAVLGILCRRAVSILIRRFYEIPKVFHVVWLLIKTLNLGLYVVGINSFAQSGYVVLLVNQSRLLNVISCLILLGNLLLQKSVGWGNAQITFVLHSRQIINLMFFMIINLIIFVII